MIVEAGISTFVFETPPPEYAAALWSLHGAIGFAAQVAFAFVPLAQRRVTLGARAQHRRSDNVLPRRRKATAFGFRMNIGIR
jgi:hypothetical protein